MAYTIWQNLDQVERYAQRRYRYLDQRLINDREQAMVERMFRRHRLGGRILDAPVGYGRFQPLLNSFGDVYSLDFNYFAALYQQARLGLTSGAVNGEAGALPFRDNIFDVVFSFRLLQHMHETDERMAIYREFRRVSRKWIIASYYQRTRTHQLFRRISPKQSRITMLSGRQFEDEVQAAGLSMVANLAVIPGLHAHRIALLSAE
ncbi:MAG: class I SAM-dependent methyltransferase [Candidatus Marinimicrobia bacterium]|nr:class I SAM-dependent methyltransferase [Candidatus Neomarinimicrobiota bacterium]